MPNSVNSDLLKHFYQHLKDNGPSQNYQKGNIKAMVRGVGDILRMIVITMKGS
ncbi:MAG TPA: hypothetical protein VKA09_17770 [Nitrososphaeraceae archaeon]|jgi:hypothetical protein|nr:hypothetical protein [Nitrososphaeraceae archaeon]